MKVAAADGATADLDNGVPGVLDLRVANGIVADVFLAVPHQSFHRGASLNATLRSSGQQTAIPSVLIVAAAGASICRVAATV